MTETNNVDNTTNETKEKPLQAILSFILLLVGFLSCSLVSVLTYKEADPVLNLPDLLLDNILIKRNLRGVSQWLLLCSNLLLIITILGHYHRVTIVRRIMFILGIIYLYRALITPLTSIPTTPEMSSSCSHGTWKQILSLASTGVLSDDDLCGDHVLSGHVILLVLGFLTIHQYTSERVFLLRWVSKAVSISGVVTIIMAHTNHSVEVVMAYWLTSRTWLLYHTMANTTIVRKDGEDIWWGRLVRLMEKGWAGPVPDRQDCPLPQSWRQNLVICFGIFNNVHTM